jgi:trehalose synthase
LERFREVLPPEEIEDAQETAVKFREALAGHAVWNVSSTAVGGGVAEMLQSILCYARGAGIDARWIVIQGNTDFFAVTKRIHHALHGSAGDGRPLDEDARRVYEATLRANALELVSLIQPGDIVILHDPQTVGLAPALVAAGARLIWRSHIGSEFDTDASRAGWSFLAPYLEWVPRYVFSRAAYVPDSCDHGKSVVIQPSIDPFSPKNQEMDAETVRAILVHTGLVEGPTPDDARPVFTQLDGTPGRVERHADLITCGRLPSPEVPLVVQISRWDPLKDMGGVLEGFARCAVDPGRPSAAQLVLAGPNVNAVADDPEGRDSFDHVLHAWRALPHSLRSRVHLACLPMADVGENAAIVNALQRHATVVVQKSLHEGFGLTVTEAMWKARPVVASAVGGIQDQIEDGVSGVLLKDPTDLDTFAKALGDLLADPERARLMGERARKRVRDHFLGVRHLLEYARLIDDLEAGETAASN